MRPPEYHPQTPDDFSKPETKKTPEPQDALATADAIWDITRREQGELMEAVSFNDLIDQRADELFGAAITPERTEFVKLVKNELAIRTEKIKTLTSLEIMGLESPLWGQIMDVLHNRFFPDKETGPIREMLTPLMIQINTTLRDTVEEQFGRDQNFETRIFVARQTLLDIVLYRLRLLPESTAKLERNLGIAGFVKWAIYRRKQPSDLAGKISAFVQEKQVEIVGETDEWQQRIKNITPEDLSTALEQSLVLMGQSTELEEASETAMTLEPPVSSVPEAADEPLAAAEPVVETVSDKTTTEPIEPEIAEEIQADEPSELGEPLIEQLVTKADQTVQKLGQFFKTPQGTLLLSGILAGTILVGAKIGSDHQREKEKEKVSFHGPVTPERIYEDLQRPVHEALTFDRDQIIEDKIVLHPDGKAYSSELLYRMGHLSHVMFDGGNAPDPEQMVKFRNTIKLLQSAKGKWPQAVRFKVNLVNDKYSLSPIDWNDHIEIKETVSTPLVITGGELEGLAAAIHQAKLGNEVTVIYAVGKLGDLNSDTGANMAYFDGVQGNGVSFLAELNEIFHEGLGMEKEDIVSIPNDHLHEKLEAFIKQRYPSVRLVPTRTLNSMHASVDQSSSRKTLLTEEGLSIISNNLVDMTPDCIVGEKFGLDMDPATPNLSYGMVFDIKGIKPEVLDQLDQAQATNPDRIMAALGVNKDFLHRHPDLVEAYMRCQKATHEATYRAKHYRWGYRGLGQGFNFYMQILGSKMGGERGKAIHLLNNIRVTDGFNLAIHDGGRATLNSISYKWPNRLHQGDHDLYQDSEFSDIRSIEIPALQHYMQIISQDKSLSVSMPHEFYVRQATAYFPTLAPRNMSDLSIQPLSDPSKAFRYYNDLRGITARDATDKSYLVAQTTTEHFDHKPLYLQASEKSSVTSIPGLYLVNKNCQSPESFGLARLQQNLALNACVTVDSINSGQIESIASALRSSSPQVAKRYNPFQPLQARALRRKIPGTGRTA